MKLISFLAFTIVAVSLSAQSNSVISTPVLGTSTTSSANNNAAATLTQNFAASDPTTGRLFTNAVQPYQAPVLPYLGPFSSGGNIIDDLRLIPEIISLEQAKEMYNGGVSARINKMSDGSYQFKECRLLTQLPTKTIIQDGKEVLVPDDSKFERRAFIFLQGNKHATTVDVVAKGVIEALNNGANAIFLIKKVVDHQTSSKGWGLGFGYVSGGINGNQMDQAQSSSAGTGINFSTAKPIYTDNIVVMAIRELPVKEPIKNTSLTVTTPTVISPVIQEVKSPINIVVNETSLHFYNGKAELTPEGVRLINNLVVSLRNKANYTLLVSGFTSAVGANSFNNELSKQRAETVAKMLVSSGIPSKYIKTAGKTENNYSDNRRVEIEVITANN